MTQEERNNWLVKNIDIITSTIERYCKKHEDLDFDDVYMDVMEYFIKRLDGCYGDELIDISKSKITQLTGHRITAIRRSVKPEEDPHDPSDFERIYIPDLESGITLWEYQDVPLTERERLVFDYYITGNYTLDEIAAMHGVTRERVRQIYEKACKKIFFKKYFRNGTDEVYFRIKIYGRIKVNNANVYSDLRGTVVVKAINESGAIRRARELITDKIKNEHNVSVLDFDVYFQPKTSLTYFISKHDDLEAVDICYDKSIFNKRTNPEPKEKKLEFEEVNGYLVTYKLKLSYYKKATEPMIEQVVVTLPVELRLVTNNDENARFYAMRYAKDKLLEIITRAREKDDVVEYELLSPLSKDEVKLKKVTFRRLK